MAACGIGFLLVFAAIKLHTSRMMYKRKAIINEENPQMEWDDSGLNITENPLDNLEVLIANLTLHLKIILYIGFEWLNWSHKPHRESNLFYDA